VRASSCACATRKSAGVGVKKLSGRVADIRRSLEAGFKPELSDPYEAVGLAAPACIL